MRVSHYSCKRHLYRVVGYYYFFNAKNEGETDIALDSILNGKSAVVKKKYPLS